MEESAFQRELSKYKVVRKADHYKMRYKKQEKKAVTESRSASSVVSPEKKSTSATTSGDFWDIMSAGPRAGLNSAEWTKLIASMKHSQHQIVEILNLEDLEALAAHVQ